MKERVGGRAGFLCGKNVYVVVKTNRCVGAGTRLSWKRRGDLVGPDRGDPDGGERERVVKFDDARSPFDGQDVGILLGIAS